MTKKPLKPRAYITMFLFQVGAIALILYGPPINSIEMLIRDYPLIAICLVTYTLFSITFIMLLTTDYNENEIIASHIKNFQPTKRWRNEEGYQAELIQYLKIYYPNAKAEYQTGASRPDIIINDVAIEVKGPTDSQALNTLTTKCLKYSHHYLYIIIVLFELRVSEAYYDEVYKGIKNTFSNVEVIRK